MQNIELIQLQNSSITEVKTIENGIFKDKNCTYGDLPKICRVVIESKPSKDSLIISELWLPENWNGIFVGLGNGGMAGTVCYDVLTQYARLGYAAANTDMGTSRGVKSGIDNPDVWKDFGWRATHIMTEVSKTILRAYYGKKEAYSYFIGASTGGQQAHSEAQRFPEDYDGIISGVPANNRVFLHTYFLWNHNHLRTKDGKVMFSAEEVNLITDCAVKFFNANGDGEPGDNFITFPYIDEFTVDNFLSFLKSKHPEFTAEQLNSLDAVYRGPVNPKTKKQIYNGMPIGSEIYPCGILSCQSLKSPEFYPFIWAFGENYNGYDFDFAEDLDRISERLSCELNANNADLTDFYNRGGKLIVYSGSADPCVPFPDSVGYYNRVCEKMGGYDKVKSFFKFFIIPGKDHNIGGKGANATWSDEERNDIFCALRDWCEKGKEPEYLVAGHIKIKENDTNPEFVRKVYPYRADKENGISFPKSCDEGYLS